MALYLARRLLRGLLTVFGVLTAAFFIIRVNGNPAVLMLPEGTPEEIATLDHTLGFDRPLHVQYLDFLGGALRGDFGDSIQQPGVSSLQLVLDRMPATLELAIAAFLVGIIVGPAIAIIVQLTGYQWLRTTVLWVSIFRQATPTFMFGVLLVLVFAVKLQWLPSIGTGGLRNLILPTLTLASFEVILYMRLVDSSLGAQQGMDYVRTAYAKGQRRSVVLFRHMLPNAVLPIVTVAGLNFGALLGGVVIVENVFNWQGVGQLVIKAVNARDFPVVQATLIVIATIFVVVNILVDQLYVLLDPRVKLR